MGNKFRSNKTGWDNEYFYPFNNSYLTDSIDIFRLYLDEVKFNWDEWSIIKEKFSIDKNNNKLDDYLPDEQESETVSTELSESKIIHTKTCPKKEAPLTLKEIIDEKRRMKLTNENNNLGDRYDLSLINKYPLGMHLIKDNYCYNFWVRESHQSRADFIEVNHIPVADLKTNAALKEYMYNNGWLNSLIQDPQLYRRAAKSTVRNRNIISLKCKFDVELEVSDYFMSPKGIDVRAYSIIGPTWTASFSAFHYFEVTIGYKNTIINNTKLQHFVKEKH